jgi:diguanylate cyclase (GGDEF)-like protein
VETKLTWTNNELEDLVRQLNIALEASGIGIWQHNLLKNQTRWDEQLQRIYGINKGLLDVVWLESVHPDDCSRASALFEEAIRNRSDYASEFRIIRPNGAVRHIRSRAKYFVDGQGEPCFIGAEWDVTEDVLRNEQLAREREAADSSRADARYAADHDYLTGLLNRRAFDEAFAALGREAGRIVSVCHIDIDRFKDINDRFGHAGGDQVLRHVGSLLTACVGDGEIAARLGGDEFVIVSHHLSPGRDSGIVRDLRQALRRPLDIDGEPFVIECSIGLASAPSDQLASLLASSDLALYEAKRGGRNRDELFSPSLANKINAEKQLLQELKTGLRAGEVVPFYQVQVDARSYEICGLEALARWESAKGVRSPAEFLPLAAAHGLMEAIDDAILQRALFDINRWSLADLDVPRVSVNLSAERLADPNLPAKVKQLQIPPGRISFELIETIFFDSLSGQVKRNIDKIRECGIDIEIDDLGSGHASLLGLVELRPNRVKIDRQLVLPVLENETQRRLIGSLIDIARSLDVEIVAEGVETIAHAEVLAKLGADILQGYAFGRPQPVSAITSLLQNAAITPRRKAL